MVMENFTIEKMEIKRFNALLVRTIASTLLMGWIVWEMYCMDNNVHTKIMSYLNILVLLIFMIVTWKTSATLEKIKNDKRLAEALDGEIYSVYNYKSLATGFYAALIGGGVVFILGEPLNLSVHTGALIIVFIAGLSSQIRKLILYKP